MSDKKIKKVNIIGLIIIISTLIVDQVVKLLTTLYISEGSVKIVIPNVLEFHHVVNTGASFGMLENSQLFFFIITIISLVVFGYMFYLSDFKKKKVFSISTALFISGTLGNAIDRVFRNGGVIDTFHVPFIHLFGIPNFIFNMADVYLNIAVVLFIIDILFLESKRRVDENEEV